MNQGIISTRYAKALIMAGEENGCLDALKADMELLGAAVRENPEFRHALDNPVITPSQKRRAMAELLEKRVHPLTFNFVNIIIRNRRELLLADVARSFADLYEKRKGIRRVRVASASPMDEQTRQLLLRRLNAMFGEGVQATFETAPSLIGGFVLRAGDLQYDASLLTGLKRMRKTLTARHVS